MPNPSTGIQQRIAFKKAGVWGTAVACGAGDEVLFLSGQAKRSAPVEIDQSRGASFSKDGTAGQIDCPVTYTANLRYVGLDVIIAMFMGIAGAPTQQGATTAYKNIYKFSPDVYGLMVTIAKLMGPYIEEVPTAKISELSISGEVGPKPLTLSITGIGINKEVASLVNTLATFASCTLPTGADKNPVMFSQCVFRMNSQGGLALAGGDVINTSKFTLSLKRNVSGEYNGAYRTSAASPQDLRDEPSNAGMPELKLALEFPLHTSATYLADLGNDARKKMDITMTGAQIAAPYNYQHLLQFPHLQMVNADPTDDQGRIKEPLEFHVHGASAAPAGMVGITDPLWWTVINTRTTDPLA